MSLMPSFRMPVHLVVVSPYPLDVIQSDTDPFPMRVPVDVCRLKWHVRLFTWP